MLSCYTTVRTPSNTPTLLSSTAPASAVVMMMQVDVWATGILAYELVVGRPPFEVNDEVQTATMIMFSNNIVYPPKHSALWADFVKVALEKKPHIRPTALQMLDHPWYALLVMPVHAMKVCVHAS